ncbi:MAG TPA: Crp/Fnr family transcriptional regulator, partial [Flavisolibacter sp.]|nr:Crp/Fnr family transcriptional regulator [Flavisolibacter sp.]
MKTEELIIEYSTFIRTLRKNKALRFTKMAKYVCYLKEGFIKIAVVNKDGREAIKYLLQAGNFFGTTTLLGQTENPDDYAVAMEDAVIVFIDTEKMRQCMNTHPGVRLDVLQQLSRRIQKAENRLLSMIFQDARSRICQFLKEFAL